MENETFEVTVESDHHNGGWIDWENRIVFIGIPPEMDIPEAGLEYINMPEGIDVFAFLNLKEQTSLEENATALANWSVALNRTNQNYEKISKGVQTILQFQWHWELPETA